MTEIEYSLFKTESIQGLAAGAEAILTKDAAFKVGHGLATYLQRFHQVNRVVVGRDNRLTSYDLQQAVVEGLRRAGTHVTDLGLISTPLMHWHAVSEAKIGGVMVTGGGLAPNINGFKMTLGNKSLAGSDIKLIHAIIREKNYTYGSGDYTANQSAYSQYVHDLRERLPMAKPLKIVADLTSGTGALFFPRLADLWKHTLVGLNEKPMSSALVGFDQVDVKRLARTVMNEGADIGLAFNVDASTVMIINERGQPIAADRIVALLAREALKGRAGSAIVADVLSSRVIPDVVERALGKVVWSGSGHAALRNALQENNALIGGSLGGHFVAKGDYLGFGDVYYVIGKLLQFLSAIDKPLSELDAELPRYHSTPEYRLECPNDEKQRVLDGFMVAMVNKGTLSEVDGIRVQFENGWGLLQADPDMPALHVRFEAAAADYITLYRKWFSEALAQFPMVGKLPTE